MCNFSHGLNTKKIEIRDATNHPHHPVLKNEIQKVMKKRKRTTVVRKLKFSRTVFKDDLKTWENKRNPRRAICVYGRIGTTHFRWSGISLVDETTGEQEKKQGSCVHRFKFFALVGKTAIRLQMALPCHLKLGMEQRFGGNLIFLNVRRNSHGNAWRHHDTEEIECIFKKIGKDLLLRYNPS